MATKKKEQKGGRPANWKEICMERVPPWPGKEKPPEPAKTEESPEPVED